MGVLVGIQEIVRSVIAVPPLARREDLSIDRVENRRLIRYLTKAGVKTLLYGGNANLYHVSLAEYPGLLEFLRSSVPGDVQVIPSVGPMFGTMRDQAEILKNLEFSAAMLLPAVFPVTPSGIEAGVRDFCERTGIPIILYLKQENYLTPPRVARLVEEGLVLAIKYAVVRADPSQDPYLRSLVRCVDPRRVISGIGEQPAMVHMRDFGLAGFTSGCVCVAPRLSMRMLEAIRSGNLELAEQIRTRFARLEELRNRYGPIPVLHEAVALAGIARTGTLLPLMTNLDGRLWPVVKEAARDLKSHESKARRDGSPEVAQHK